MINEAELDTAVNIIARGGIVIIPTDTIYGLSCDPDNIRAVLRLNSLKGRDRKPYIILDSDFQRLGKYISYNNFVVTFTNFLFENSLWPGNITVVTEKNPDLEYDFLKDRDKIAVRLTDFYPVRYITDKFGSGIVSTSVNTSGGENLNDFDIIDREWGSKVDLVVKGDSTGNKASMIVELFNDEEMIRILRSSDDLSAVKIRKKFRILD
ncbi:MAG: Sua5/YciO/YrdC/YwlC family protein [Candidatus Delongbacteria bacterium]|nr:Sua5/YciO/YrdC/YwlC family protein [Candidatus Delongbacteria bacterium]MDD4205007.1 Sua5/YciO/YrdC/YwlC family protein [Candidatus Delongbacteria bacterium]